MNKLGQLFTVNVCRPLKMRSRKVLGLFELVLFQLLPLEKTQNHNYYTKYRYCLFCIVLLYPDEYVLLKEPQYPDLR
jgi:hypothetical protein